jgi:hypothetical protein
MAQVVTSQNFQQLLTTGRVDDFKPPEASPADVKPPATATTPKGEALRGADGKFTKPAEGDKTTTASSSTPATGEDDDEKDLPEVVRQKIGKKHRQMKEAEEFAKGAYQKQLRAEGEAESLRRQLESYTKSRPATEQAPTEEKEPKPEDFKTVGEYIDAAVKFGVKKTRAEEKAAEAKQREEETKAAREVEFGKRLNVAREKHDDFDVTLQSLSGTDMDRVHPDVVEYIQESEHGPELLYHLAKNRDVLDRLRKQSPRQFIAALGKQEAKWEEAPKPVSNEPAQKLSDIGTTPAPTPAVSRAPAPIAALSSDKGTVVQKDPSQMSFAELRAYERQREAERRARH